MAGRFGSWISSCSLALVVLSLIAADWPSFAGPNGDFTSPERGVVWPPKLLWQIPAGEGYTNPTVVGNRAYLFDRDKASSRLRALDVATGKVIWATTYPTDYVDKLGFDGGPRTMPVIANGRVYAFGPEGRLICAALADGKRLWEHDTSAKYGVVQNFFGVGSTPLVEGELLIVAVGGSPPGREPEDFRDLKGNGTALVAFDLATGAERWRLSDGLAAYSSPMVVTQGGRRRGYYMARGGLIAFDPAKGTVDFHYPWRAKQLDSVNAANPLVVGNTVLISETYALGSALLKVKSIGPPEVLWKDEPNARVKNFEAHWAPPIHVDGYVYGCSGRHSANAELRCMELATGKVVWREPDLARTTAIGVDGKLIVFGEFGLLQLVKITPTKFEELGRLDLGPKGTKQIKHYCWAPPVLADGRLYLRGKGTLSCFEIIPPGANK